QLTSTVKGIQHTLVNRTLSITLRNYKIGEIPNAGIYITAMKLQMVAMLMGCITLLILILAVLKIRFL
ncbi:MAG: hypothetical protein Q4B56_08310, partial [Erysipelotrichaceae bacterium]|nr:hypothetical protein [Erysipelotrichaceae bacterium]